MGVKPSPNLSLSPEDHRGRGAQRGRVAAPGHVPVAPSPAPVGSVRRGYEGGWQALGFPSDRERVPHAAWPAAVEVSCRSRQHVSVANPDPSPQAFDQLDLPGARWRPTALPTTLNPSSVSRALGMTGGHSRVKWIDPAGGPRPAGIKQADTGRWAGSRADAARPRTSPAQGVASQIRTVPSEPAKTMTSRPPRRSTGEEVYAAIVRFHGGESTIRPRWPAMLTARLRHLEADHRRQHHDHGRPEAFPRGPAPQTCSRQSLRPASAPPRSWTIWWPPSRTQPATSGPSSTRRAFTGARRAQPRGISMSLRCNALQAAPLNPVQSWSASEPTGRGWLSRPGCCADLPRAKGWGHDPWPANPRRGRRRRSGQPDPALMPPHMGTRLRVDSREGAGRARPRP